MKHLFSGKGEVGQGEGGGWGGGLGRALRSEPDGSGVIRGRFLLFGSAMARYCETGMVIVASRRSACRVPVGNTGVSASNQPTVYAPPSRGKMKTQ